MSLSRRHPTWSWSVTSYQVNKCVVVSRMLSERFRSGSLLRHFYEHVTGLCELCGEEVEDLPHILLPRCPLLKDRADLLKCFARDTLSENKTASEIFFAIFDDEDDNAKMQILLDPSTIPVIIAATQIDEDVLQQILTVTIYYLVLLHEQITG